MNKSERHQIKRDELVNVLERGTVYVEDHVRQVIWVAAGVLVLTAGVMAARSWWVGREERASALLGRVVQTYRAPVVTSLEALQQAAPGTQTFASVEEKDREVIRLADEILKAHASTRTAPKALYYKGLAFAGLKQTEDASKTLQDLLARHPQDFIAPLARYDLGRLLEQQGRPAEALIQYQALAEEPQGLFPREEGLMSVARCQETLGRKDEALKTYQRIVRDFPESDYLFEARKKVEELS